MTAALSALGATAAPAAADITCSRSGTTLTVTMTAEPLTSPAESMRIGVNAADQIRIQDIHSVAVTCTGGTPTVTNVDTIQIGEDITGSQDSHNTGVTIRSPSRFAPGATDAGDEQPFNLDEIEFEVDLGEGPRDAVLLSGLPFVSGDPDTVASFRAGADGVNGDVAGGPLSIEDADVFPSGVEQLSLVGGEFADDVSAAGGAGTGAPYPRKIRLFGGEGDDQLTGGAGNDYVDGGPDGDVMRGRKGADTISYLFDDFALRIDISTLGNTDGGVEDGPVGDRDDVGTDFERILGGLSDDLLIGNSRKNRLDATRGVDRMFGLGGNDVLIATDADIQGLEEKDAIISCGKGRNDKSIQSFKDPKPRRCETVKRRRA